MHWCLEIGPDRPEDDARQRQVNNLAGLLYHAERWDDARAELVVGLESGRMNEDNADHARLLLGFIAAWQGDREAGETALEEFWADYDNPYRRWLPEWLPDMNRTSLAAVLGDFDDAVRHLQQAGARGGKLGHWLSHVQPLRGYPPFEELVAGR